MEASATGGVAAPAAGAELRPGVRVRLADLQARPDLNGTVGTIASFDTAKERWAVNLSNGDGTKLFKAANLVTLEVEQADSVSQRLIAAMAADQKWSLERNAPQRRVPAGRTGVLDPFMWHIQQNVCKGNQELAKWTMSVMAHITQKPDVKHEPRLDDAGLNERVANFLKAYRDAA
mmetsp:Transcript_56299/g.112891  ORF Transcript_56299/g.112891 Transcript_56299/m.112891 type:complete len:176 (-) Transcript_56299:51-578(-)